MLLLRLLAEITFWPDIAKYSGLKSRQKGSFFCLQSIDLNAINNCGTTAFHVACIAGHDDDEVVKLVL